MRPTGKGLLRPLGEACARSAWQVHAYCLMSNHFHLVVETPQPTLVAGMKWFPGTYTGRFNRRLRFFGHVFSGRYKALIVHGSGKGYLRTVCEHVHLNPERAKLLQPQQPLRDYRWSSWPAYVPPPGKRPAWLRVERVLGELGIPKDTVAGRRGLERVIEWRRGRRQWRATKPFDGDGFSGGKAFKKQLLAQMSERLGPEHYGEERQASQEEKAEQVVAEELRRRQWKEVVSGAKSQK